MVSSQSDVHTLLLSTRAKVRLIKKMHVNASCAVGDFAYKRLRLPFFFREMWFTVRV